MWYFGCMSKAHHYHVTTRWTGNLGSGTLDYRAYTRDHTVSVAGKTGIIECSSDPAFRGDAARYNPEELFLSSLSACHMLWYLHLASVNDVTVLAYEDRVTATMEEDADGAGRFTSVTLHPQIKVAAGTQVQRAEQLHAEAGRKCFIANSIKVAVGYVGDVSVGLG